MGIKGLAKLLSDEAPECVKEVPLKSLHGRKIAIDASMAIYQFLIAVRQSSATNPAAMLTNANGDTTSHIQGLFNRTIRFLTEGIRPAYVFDGTPPNIKSHELTKRREKREKATRELEKAKEDGNLEEQAKQEKRLVRAGQKENDECKRLLRLMGVPVIESPCEAEAQAASLCIEGKVWAVGTEDMDALTFRTPILLRKMTFANASKSDIQQMDYKKAIDGLGLTQAEFVDLCILLGCDYCDSIRGIGPKTALKLIRQYSSIENILDNIDRKKYTVPHEWVPHEEKKVVVVEKEEKKEKKDVKKKNGKKKVKDEDEDDEDYDGEKDEKDEKDDDTEQDEKETKKEEETKDNDEQKETKETIKEEDAKPKEEEEVEEQKDTKPKEEEQKDTIEKVIPQPIYIKARQLFNEHEVLTNCELKWTECQAEELTKYLVDDMCFNPDRVASSIIKLQKAFKATSKPQLRMDSFFKPLPSKKKKKVVAVVAAVKKGGGGVKRKGGKADGKKNAKKGSFGRKR